MKTNNLRAEWPLTEVLVGLEWSPYRLWSLYDMLRFHADFFTRACLDLDRLCHRLPSLDSWRNDVEIDLAVIQKECERIGFKYLAEQAQRIIDKATLKAAPQSIYNQQKQEIQVLLQELRNGIEQKLRVCFFLRVNTDKIPFYSEEDLPLFGKEVVEAFPKSTYHVAEAGRCFALERWDACVHHLMLATEEALRKWAINLKLKTDRPLILSDWEKILNAGRSLLKDLKNKPKTLVTDRKIQKIAETLAHFEAVKEAWRNHSSHGREKYDERRAKNIFGYVEEFMRGLAVKTSKAKKKRKTDLRRDEFFKGFFTGSGPGAVRMPTILTEGIPRKETP